MNEKYNSGEDRLAELIRKLIDDHRDNEVRKVAADEDYRKKMYAQYGI